MAKGSALGDTNHPGPGPSWAASTDAVATSEPPSSHQLPVDRFLQESCDEMCRYIPPGTQ